MRPAKQMASRERASEQASERARFLGLFPTNLRLFRRDACGGQVQVYIARCRVLARAGLTLALRNDELFISFSYGLREAGASEREEDAA